jgi:hypothetical protein
MARCHSAMAEEFEDSKQRHAVCMGSWRKAKGGKKPKASATGDRLISVFNVAQEIELRREMLGGKEHIVLPLISLVEGVYQCANCPAPNYYPAREFGKNPGAWNGRPVTIGHPVRGETYVSAGSPDVWENERIGTLFNARLDGDKLKVEAWLDPEMVKRAGAEAAAVLAAVEAGEQVEVSTAAWIDEQPRFGAYRGRKYEAVQINFQPDHTALLPLGQIGACSWGDGCGVRVAHAGACCDACARGEDCECHEDHGPEAHQTARSLETALQIAVSERSDDAYVVDWDEEFVYYASFDAGRGAIWRLDYSEDEDGNVTLGEGEPERVRPRHDFFPVVAVNSSSKETGEMAEDTKKAAAGTEQPTADQQPPAKADPKQPDQDKPRQQQHLSATDKYIAELEAKVEHLTALQKEKPKPATLDEYIENAPPELRESLFAMHKETERKRLQLVDRIKEAPGNLYSDDELAAMQVKDLERLVSIAAGRADYRVQPAERSRLTRAADSDDYVPAPASPWDKPKTPAN